MESVKKLLLKRILPIILAFVLIVTSSIYPEKKVKAEAATLLIGGSVVIVGLLLSGLVASGAISGDYTVTAPDLTAITEKAQANLQAAGVNAVEQANRLGEAIKSGAESAKIKALASGAVIYAFLQAIQETLFPDRSIPESDLPTSIKGNLFATLGDYNFYCEVLDSASLAKAPFPVYDGWKIGNIASYGTSEGYISKHKGFSYYNRVNICQIYVLNTLTNNRSGYWYRDSGSGIVCMDRYDLSDINNGEFTPIMDALLNVSEVKQNVVYDNSYVSNLQHHDSVTVPTVLPQTIINNINNWDSTSDLVLAPPLPYDIPTGEDLVIDPSYVGEGTVDPPTPTTDPDNPPSEEEGITLPWLAALLGLLGLGQLTGIDEGVKSGIDNLVDSISNTAQDVYDGVRDWADTARSTIAQGIEGVRAKLGEIAGVITGGLALGIESIQSALGSITETIGHAFDPPSKNVDWDKLKNIQLFNKFPFSIPSDLYYLFGLVAADPVAPCVKIPFDMTFLGGENIDATVDLATYDNVAGIIRSFEFIAFVIGMLYLTKSLIWK